MLIKLKYNRVILNKGIKGKQGGNKKKRPPHVDRSMI